MNEIPYEPIHVPLEVILIVEKGDIIGKDALQNIGREVTEIGTRAIVRPNGIGVHMLIKFDGDTIQR